MLNRIYRSLFGSANPPRQPFHDPVLGELRPDELGWSVNVTRGDESFGFTIGGVHQPDAALLAHARDILNDFESFQRAVRDCIESESGDYPADVRAALAELRIDNISLCWPDRPDDGMIFFRGADENGEAWRCDYIDRKPVGLGCDR